MNPFESLNSIDLGLWPHQAMLADDTIKAIRRGLNCCSVLATGGGKSLAMTETTRQILAGGLYSTVGVACHSVDILRQLEVDLRKLRVPIGWVAAGEPGLISAPIQLISTATAIRRAGSLTHSSLFKRLRSSDTILICDECHRSTSGKFGELFWSSDCLVTGWTASPWKSAGKTLADNFDCIVPGPLPGELMDAGYLVYPRYVEPPGMMSADGLPILAGDFSGGAISKLWRENPKATREALEFVLEAVPDGKFIFFVSDTLHAQQVQAELQQMGAVSEIILADTEGRAEALTRIKRSPKTHGVSIDVMSTGIDIPDLAGVVFLRHTMSPVVYAQQLGRGLRTFPGKHFCWVFDFVGNVNRHFRPEEIEEYLFEGVKKKGTREISEKTCPVCETQNGSLRLRCKSCNFLFEESCPVCNRDLFFSQNTCRSCGYDKRDAEEQLAAEKAAMEKLELLRRSFSEKNNFVDSVEDFRYTYSQLVIESYNNLFTSPEKPLRWLESQLRPGVGAEVLQPYTTYTLWPEEQVLQDSELYFRSYGQRLLRYRPLLVSEDVKMLMGLQFGSAGRQWLAENFSIDAPLHWWNTGKKRRKARYNRVRK